MASRRGSLLPGEERRSSGDSASSSASASPEYRNPLLGGERRPSNTPSSPSQAWLCLLVTVPSLLTVAVMLWASTHGSEKTVYAPSTMSTHPNAAQVFVSGGGADIEGDSHDDGSHHLLASVDALLLRAAGDAAHAAEIDNARFSGVGGAEGDAAVAAWEAGALTDWGRVPRAGTSGVATADAYVDELRARCQWEAAPTTFFGDYRGWLDTESWIADTPPEDLQYHGRVPEDKTTRSEQDGVDVTLGMTRCEIVAPGLDAEGAVLPLPSYGGPAPHVWSFVRYGPFTTRGNHSWHTLSSHDFAGVGERLARARAAASVDPSYAATDATTDSADSDPHSASPAAQRRAAWLAGQSGVSAEPLGNADGGTPLDAVGEEAASESPLDAFSAAPMPTDPYHAGHSIAHPLSHTDIVFVASILKLQGETADTRPGQFVRLVTREVGKLAAAGDFVGARALVQRCLGEDEAQTAQVHAAKAALAAKKAAEKAARPGCKVGVPGCEVPGKTYYGRDTYYAGVRDDAAAIESAEKVGMVKSKEGMTPAGTADAEGITEIEVEINPVMDEYNGQTIMESPMDDVHSRASPHTNASDVDGLLKALRTKQTSARRALLNAKDGDGESEWPAPALQTDEILQWGHRVNGARLRSDKVAHFEAGTPLNDKTIELGRITLATRWPIPWKGFGMTRDKLVAYLNERTGTRAGGEWLQMQCDGMGDVIAITGMRSAAVDSTTGEIIPDPPIHLHHSHFYDEFRHLFGEWHADSHCSAAQGGTACNLLLLPDGFRMSPRHPMLYTMDVNDVRGLDSEPVSFFLEGMVRYQWSCGDSDEAKRKGGCPVGSEAHAPNLHEEKAGTAARVSPTGAAIAPSRTVALMSHSNPGMGVRDATPSVDSGKVRGLAVYTMPDAYSLLWMSETFPVSGTYVSNFIHSHQKAFDSGLVFAASPSTLGLVGAGSERYCDYPGGLAEIYSGRPDYNADENIYETAFGTYGHKVLPGGAAEVASMKRDLLSAVMSAASRIPHGSSAIRPRLWCSANHSGVTDIGGTSYARRPTIECYGKARSFLKGETVTSVWFNRPSGGHFQHNIFRGHYVQTGGGGKDASGLDVARAQCLCETNCG